MQPEDNEHLMKRTISNLKNLGPGSKNDDEPRNVANGTKLLEFLARLEYFDQKNHSNNKDGPAIEDTALGVKRASIIDVQQLRTMTTSEYKLKSIKAEFGLSQEAYNQLKRLEKSEGAFQWLKLIAMEGSREHDLWVYDRFRLRQPECFQQFAKFYATIMNQLLQNNQNPPSSDDDIIRLLASTPDTALLLDLLRIWFTEEIMINYAYHKRLQTIFNSITFHFTKGAFKFLVYHPMLPPSQMSMDSMISAFVHNFLEKVPYRTQDCLNFLLESKAAASFAFIHKAFYPFERYKDLIEQRVDESLIQIADSFQREMAISPDVAETRIKYVFEVLREFPMLLERTLPMLSTRYPEYRQSFMKQFQIFLIHTRHTAPEILENNLASLPYNEELNEFLISKYELLEMTVPEALITRLNTYFKKSKDAIPQPTANALRLLGVFLDKGAYDSPSQVTAIFDEVLGVLLCVEEGEAGDFLRKLRDLGKKKFLKSLFIGLMTKGKVDAEKAKRIKPIFEKYFTEKFLHEEEMVEVIGELVRGQTAHPKALMQTIDRVYNGLKGNSGLTKKLGEHLQVFYAWAKLEEDPNTKRRVATLIDTLTK
jgi:hypothetical protein